MGLSSTGREGLTDSEGEGVGVETGGVGVVVGVSEDTAPYGQVDSSKGLKRLKSSMLSKASGPGQVVGS